MGDICQKKGKKGMFPKVPPFQHYPDLFLFLRKDADSGIADVEDAKKRLVGLY